MQTLELGDVLRRDRQRLHIRGGPAGTFAEQHHSGEDRQLIPQCGVQVELVDRVQTAVPFLDVAQEVLEQRLDGRGTRGVLVIDSRLRVLELGDPATLHQVGDDRHLCQRVMRLVLWRTGQVEHLRRRVPVHRGHVVEIVEIPAAFELQQLVRDPLLALRLLDQFRLRRTLTTHLVETGVLPGLLGGELIEDDLFQHLLHSGLRRLVSLGTEQFVEDHPVLLLALLDPEQDVLHILDLIGGP